MLYDDRRGGVGRQRCANVSIVCQSSVSSVFDCASQRHVVCQSVYDDDKWVRDEVVNIWLMFNVCGLVGVGLPELKSRDNVRYLVDQMALHVIVSCKKKLKDSFIFVFQLVGW